MALTQFGGLRDNARALRHMLALGADANLRCSAYNMPNLYSVTPLSHLIVSLLMTGMADGMGLDVAAGARALLEAGADPDARVDVLNTVSPGAETPLGDYAGPPMGFTPVMLLANTSPTASPRALDVLRALIAKGADLGARNAGGATTRDMPMAAEAAAIIN